MEVRAVAKYVRVQPRKVRIIADEVRGKSAAYTVSLLRYHPSKSAKMLRKVIISAMANAAENHNLMPGRLEIKRIEVNEGPRIKRIQPRAMGRAFRIVKKMSHITVVVGEGEAVAVAKPHGTKPKARPTFAAPKKGKKKAAEAKAEESMAAAEVVEAPVEETVEVVEAAEAPVVEAEPVVEDVEAEKPETEEKGAE